MRYTLNDFYILTSEYDYNLLASTFFRTAVTLAINNMIEEYAYLMDFDFCPRGFYISFDFSKGTLTLTDRIKNPTITLTDSYTYWLHLLKANNLRHQLII